MPVYLVASQKTKAENLWSWMEAWGRFIKGPVDHVELAFVNPGRPVYGYGITARSQTPKFGQRVYDEQKQDAKFVWYEIPGMDEKKCEVHCVSRVGKDRISLELMTQSAMPFESAGVASWVMRLVGDLPADLKVETKDDGLPPAFCSTTTIRALQAGFPTKLDDIEDPERYTANDVVVLVLRRLGAKRMDTNPTVAAPKPTGQEEDEDMIRSDRWV